MIVDPTPDDHRFMAEALQTASRVPRRPWPNPPVGALVVRSGRIVGRGAHHGPGEPHAEALALAAAGADAAGAVLYTTLEPCNHAGRMPPCAPLVASSGVSRVVVAVADPNPLVAGGGLERVHAAGINVTIGVLAEAALDLIWPFAATRAFARPYVLLKTATSLDGRFAPDALRRDVPPAPTYLTGERARRDVHRLRRWSDLVLVGEGTVIADRPQLNGRMAAGDDCPAADPVPAWADTDLSLDEAWPGSAAYVFVGRERARAADCARVSAQGVTVVRCRERDGHIAPESLVEEAARCAGPVIMVEGGPTLAASFLQAGLVDRWVQYTAPVLLGNGPGWPAFVPPSSRSSACGFELTRVERLGLDTKAVYDRVVFGDLLCELTVGRLDRLRAERDSR